jgi:hypothetical protein
MKSALVIALLGVSTAAADEAPLIPDCYAANQSQSEFHDCVRGSTTAVASRTAKEANPARQTLETEEAGTAPSNPDASGPPAGMWEREHRTSSANAPSGNSYAGLPEPPPEAEGPPYMDGSQSDEDGPQWRVPSSDGPDYSYGPRSNYGPPPGGWADEGNSWPDEEGPADDGPDY